MVRTLPTVNKKRKQPAKSYETFSSSKAEQRFSDIFASRELWMEKGFAMTQEVTMGLPLYVHAQIEARGWGTFCLHPEGPVATIVREFYSNLVEPKAWRVKVRGVWVPLNSKAINSVYELDEEDCGYAQFLGHMEDETWDNVLQVLTVEGTQWIISTQGYRTVKRSQLSQEAKVWYYFIRTRLMPTTHDTTVAQDRMALLFCLMTGIPINVGKIIVDQIRLCAGKLQGKLFFPCLITSLCIDAGVPDFDDEPRTLNLGMINSATIQRILRETVMESPAKSKKSTAPEVSEEEDPTTKPRELAEHLKLIFNTQRAELNLLSTQLQEFQQQQAKTLNAYLGYRKKFDKAVKATLKYNFPEGIPKFPKFPPLLINKDAEGTSQRGVAAAAVAEPDEGGENAEAPEEGHHTDEEELMTAEDEQSDEATN